MGKQASKQAEKDSEKTSCSSLAIQGVLEVGLFFMWEPSNTASGNFPVAKQSQPGLPER